jgi:N-acetylglucosamine kinase-like BadF-type ATPase
MQLFLGIDGGGTKTKIVIINHKREILFENTEGPSSIDTVCESTTYNNILNAIKPFITPSTTIVSVFAGLGGIVFEEDFLNVESIIKRMPFINSETLVKARNDMENALYSGLCFDEGMTLICGTGMVAFGKNNHSQHKAGGWGYKEGELGSAYHLGVEALRHLIRTFDNRRKSDDFSEDLAQELNFTKATDIIKLMDEYHSSRTKTAALAPYCTKHANLGNKHAMKICDVATHELSLAVEAVYKKLGFNQTKLVVVGSLGNSKGYFQEKLHENIKAISKNIEITGPIIDPALAAAYMALKLYEQRG